jgi:hypothetical protein
MSTTKRTKKLTLNRETIQILDRGELDHANGGASASVIFTYFGCRVVSFGFCTGQIIQPRPRKPDPPAPQSFGFCTQPPGGDNKYTATLGFCNRP